MVARLARPNRNEACYRGHGAPPTGVLQPRREMRTCAAAPRRRRSGCPSTASPRLSGWCRHSAVSGEKWGTVGAEEGAAGAQWEDGCYTAAFGTQSRSGALDVGRANTGQTNKGLNHHPALPGGRPSGSTQRASVKKSSAAPAPGRWGHPPAPRGTRGRSQSRGNRRCTATTKVD